MKNEILKKRTDLVIDYISQILVYGADTKGTITIDQNKFDDGAYLILTVSVIKNSYFRWHDLGLLTKDSIYFYQLVIDGILTKFKDFTIQFDDNTIYISSAVNRNQIDIHFTFTNPKEINWFQKQRDLFYNKSK